MSRDARPFDVILFGATGFTGRLTARYLAKVAASGTPLRFAIAGRDRGKLEAIARELEIVPEVIVADVADPGSLAHMAERAHAVATTVGPYAQYGEPVVRACVERGTDYADITGEPAFVDAIVRGYHQRAVEKRVRIVSCCGFDSIPHDLGALFTVRRLPKDVPIRLEGFVRTRGTFSGGTWHSAIGAFANRGETLKARKGLWRASEGEARRKVGRIPARLRYVRALSAWAVPLPTIDPDIVLRTARLLDDYGPDFRYGHYARVKSTGTIVFGAAAVGTIAALAQVPVARKLLLRAKSPGDGPSAEERARGFFRVTFLATAGKERLRTAVSGGDPGYDETAKMLAESAMCLALDRDTLPARFGALTPAAAMDDALITRLVRAGIRFEVETEGSE